MMFGTRRKDRDRDRELAEVWQRATAAANRHANAHLDDVRRAHAAQCEHLANDVVTWQRRALDVVAGAKRVDDTNKLLREENSELREQVATLQSRSALAALDGEYEVLFDRMRRALRGCRRYRGQVADQAALLRAQQRQLDAATGLDHPDIEAGAGWQQTRTDKAVPAPKLTAASPSGPLPTREPGEVAS